jgi:hypothetical protein
MLFWRVSIDQQSCSFLSFSPDARSRGSGRVRLLPTLGADDSTTLHESGRPIERTETSEPAAGRWIFRYPSCELRANESRTASRGDRSSVAPGREPKPGGVVYV